jgi:hypothetical protein
MNHQRLSQEVLHYAYLRERLVADFPDADEECLRDTLEGLTNLTDMLAEVLRSALDDQAFGSALRSRIGDMQARLSRIEERARKKRDLVCSVMERADVRKMTEPDFTVSLRPSRAPLVVTDEEVIPGDYWKAQAPKLDRQGLIAALSAGRDVPGALLGNAPMTISVRTK